MGLGSTGYYHRACEVENGCPATVQPRSHPENHAIGKELLDRVPFPTVAERFGISTTAEFRHKDHFPHAIGGGRRPP